MVSLRLTPEPLGSFAQVAFQSLSGAEGISAFAEGVSGSLEHVLSTRTIFLLLFLCFVVRSLIVKGKGTVESMDQSC